MATYESMTMRMKLEGSNKVQREFKQTGTAAKKMGRGMKAGGAGASKMTAALNPAALAAAATAAGLMAAVVAARVAKDVFIKVVRETFTLAERLDEVGKKAKAIGGVSAESLQEMVGAFELAGVSSGQSIKSMQKLNQSMGEAMRGTKTYTDAFEALGLEAGKVARMPLKERMLAIAEGMGGMSTQAEKAQVGALLFGRAWKDLVVGMGDRTTLEATIKDISRFHVASNEAVRNSEELQDALLRSNKAWEAMKTEALEPLIPVFTGVADGLALIILGLGEEGKTREFGIGLAEGLIPAVEVVMKLTGEVQKAVLVMSALSDLAVAAAAGLAAPLHLKISVMAEQYDQLGGKLLVMGDRFEEIELATEGWSEIMNQAIAEAVAAGAIPADDLVPGGGNIPGAIDRITDSYQKLRDELDAFRTDQVQASKAAAKDIALARFEKEVGEALVSMDVYGWYSDEAAASMRQRLSDQLEADFALIDEMYAKQEKTQARSKVGRRVDPLADLKKQKEALLADAHAYEESLKTKETLLRESLDRREELTLQLEEAGLLDQQAAANLRIQFAAETDAELIALEQARADEMQRIRDEEIRRDDQRRAEEAEKLKAYQAAQVQAQVDVLMTVGTVAAQIGSMIASLADENNEEAQRAAKALFLITQAASLGVAIVKTSEAIAIANALPPPGNIPAMISASAIGAAQIATIVGTTISGMAHAGLPPGALGGANEATILMRRDEMILDPVGTRAISRMLDQRGGGQPVQVHTTLEIDGQVLGRTVDDHLVRSSERGLSYQERVRY